MERCIHGMEKMYCAYCNPRAVKTENTSRRKTGQEVPWRTLQRLEKIRNKPPQDNLQERDPQDEKEKGLPLVVVDVVDEKDRFARSFIANFEREGHTPLEIGLAIQSMIDYGWTIAEIADCLGRSEPWVRRYRTLADLDPSLRPLLDPDLPREESLKVVVALQLATLSPPLQIKLWKEVLKQNMGANAARQYIRQRAIQENAIAGSPARGPRKDFALVRGSGETIESRLALLETMTDAQIQAMFEHRAQEVLGEVVYRLQNYGQRLLQLAGRINRIVATQEVMSVAG